MPNFIHILKSQLAALFGVRSEQAAEQDFAQLDHRWYIATGIVLVIVAVVLLAAVVSIIIK